MTENMRSLFALLLLLFFFLSQSATVESRKEAGEYWRMVMKDEAMPAAIQGLLRLDSQIESESKPKIHEHKCEEPLVTKATMQDKVFLEEFEPRPNLSTYNDDDVDGKENEIIKDFEYKPSVTAYNNGKVGLVNDNFEPKPNLSAYNG